MPVSHHAAACWPDHANVPAPVYPGVVWEDRTWDRSTLQDFYQPWRNVEANGATVHIREFGCFNRPLNDIAMRWFTDLFSVFEKFGWGYAMWIFQGPFGIIEHGRFSAKFEPLYCYLVDRALLDLLINSRMTRQGIR